VWRQRNGKVCFLIKLTGVDAFDRACCPFVPLKDLEAHIISALLTDASVIGHLSLSFLNGYLLQLLQKFDQTTILV